MKNKKPKSDVSDIVAKERLVELMECILDPQVSVGRCQLIAKAVNELVDMKASEIAPAKQQGETIRPESNLTYSVNDINFAQLGLSKAIIWRENPDYVCVVRHMDGLPILRRHRRQAQRAISASISLEESLVGKLTAGERLLLRHVGVSSDGTPSIRLDFDLLISNQRSRSEQDELAKTCQMALESYGGFSQVECGECLVVPSLVLKPARVLSDGFHPFHESHFEPWLEPYCVAADTRDEPRLPIWEALWNENSQ